MLTLVSLVGLVATILDYSIPRVQAKLFPETAWTAEKEKRLEQICQELVRFIIIPPQTEQEL